MWQAIVLSFLGGLMGANGVPHFVKGISKEEYPTVLGNSPVRNVVAGWAGLVIAALLVLWAHVERYPVESFIFGSLGVLFMGLFHALGGAFRMNSRFGRVNPELRNAACVPQ